MPGEFIARNGIISRGNVIVTGSLSTSGSFTTTGTITAQTLVVQTITSSISSITGSTNFGSLLANTHTFTGSLNVTGALAVTTNGVEFQVNSTGVNLGNALTDSHIISGSLRVNPNGLFVSGSGLVGIGTTSPARTLDVTGTFRIVTPNRSFFVTTNAYSISDGTLSSGIGMDGSGLYLGNVASSTGWTISNPQLTILSSGNVGIGVTPSAWGTSSVRALQIGTFGSLAWVGGVDINIFNNTYYDGTNFKYVASQEAARYLINRNNHHWYIAPAGSTGDNITFTEAARINSSGYAKFTSTGVFNDVNAQNHEFVNGTAGNNSHFIGNTNASYAGATLLRLNCVRTTTNGTYNLIAATNGNSSGEFIVRDSGNVQNTNNSYTGTSDIKLKQDIIDASSQWDDIKQMRIRKFRFKKQVEQDENAPYLLGVIAQELELISPNLVDEALDFDGTDKEVTTTTKSVKYSIIYMKAVKALQEAMAKIETLEARVQYLENK